MPKHPTISLSIEIPEVLHKGIAEYLESRPGWSQDRVMTAALSLYLLQNRCGASANTRQRQISRVYLDTLFKQPIV